MPNAEEDKEMLSQRAIFPSPIFSGNGEPQLLLTYAPLPGLGLVR